MQWREVRRCPQRYYAHDGLGTVSCLIRTPRKGIEQISNKLKKREKR